MALPLAKIVTEGRSPMADLGTTFILLSGHDDLDAMGRVLDEDVREIEG
ncbi:hypothetical protein P775_14670 [Puniceibacterium antarcticum]|uniref:Uncharacterized protein n=1 Tax=Puniceibacterium antarcticum TaxID=1206336 RepID=A0A2G8RCX7_9RHOB|nr:hypothetical protein [Puniceibacterium antarcticum]PIL19382.1 hypothetical protein P775_14670 [Puniceibacterium antarcticum]